MTFAASIVVLTEDSGASGWKPVVTLVRALCDQLIARISWERVEVLPRADAGEAALRAIAANRWKGGDGSAHGLRVQLTRYIADKLIARDGTPRFVFFHVDADRTWSEGGAAASENIAKFRRLIEPAVRVHLSAALQRSGRAGDLDALMSRLHLVVPCTCIEAWLYQSTSEATAICMERTCRGAHVTQYEAWARDRALLDDLPTLKRLTDARGVAVHCLEDRDKERLARAFPAREVRAIKRSFASAVAEVGEDGALLHALIATGAPR